MPSMLDREARVTLAEIEDALAAVPGVADPGFVRALEGQDRFAARKAIVAKLEELGLLVQIEPHTHQVPHGDRSGVPIEPRLTVQWYCNAEVLAKPAIEAVEQGRTKFVPQQWENTFFAWMRDIQPWCISRQLWWGHRIPAWYGPDGRVFVEKTEEEAIAAARAHYGHDEALTRDEDVLDTWFSSALWPFSTLGWPEQHPGSGALLSGRRAGDRVRHHLLLGRPDDDDGPAFHGRRAVPRRLHPRPGARRARPEDEQVQGQRDRPAGAHRPLRRRRAALHDLFAHRPGPRHQARPGAGGEPAQLRHQAVERGAVLRTQRRGARAGFRSRHRPRCR